MKKLLMLCAVFFAALPSAAEEDSPVSIPWLSGAALVPAQAKASIHGHVVIRLRVTPTPEQRAALKKEGVQLLAYVGEDCWFAKVDSGASSPLVSGMAEIQPAWKVHPGLANGAVPSHALLPADESKDGEDGQARCAVYVCLFRTTDAKTGGSAIVGRHGGTVCGTMASVNALAVEMPCGQIDALAAEAEVQWIEPALPALTPANDGNLVMAEVTPLLSSPYSLDGSGISVMVYDGGVASTNHPDFGSRLYQRDSTSVSAHATHVAGTIAGDGSNSVAQGGTAYQWRGIAPGVTVQSYGFEYNGTGIFFYTNPGDVEHDYTQAMSTYGADVGNASLGTNVASNGFDCSLHGNYGVTSALIDSLVRTGIPQVWSAGNERSNGRCGTGYGTVAPPAGAKNAIIVGAVNSNDASMTTFSSWGPMDDGRLRPDVCAPGGQVGGDGGTTSCGISGEYTVMSGTSMAAPVVTGICALLLQDYRAHYFGADPSCATLKALLIQTATDLGTAGPDYRFGYGLVRAQAAVDALRAGHFLESQISDDGLMIYVVEVPPGEPTLRATLVWDDYPATPNVAPQLINDLDISAVSPSGTFYYPWTLDPSNPTAAAVRTGADRLNNVEQVVVDAPEAGTWQIRVAAPSVPQGPQAFSLAAAPDLAICSDAGIVTFDSTAYSCSDLAGFSLIDCHLNVDSGSVDAATVQVYSSSDPTGQTVVASETGVDTGVFTGSVDVDSQAGTGIVIVAEGDVLTVAYDDADDGSGSPATATDTAIIDCTSPVISNISVTTTATTATISFTTDEATRGEVAYGQLCSVRTSHAELAHFGTAHDTTLSGLAPETTYYYSISASDWAGNLTTEANDGACLSFQTGSRPDYFTEYFEASGFDLFYMTWILIPDSSASGYMARLQRSVTSLPTDPSGGTILSLDDDGAEAISLADGKSALLYGMSYSQFYVGSNGFLTFGDDDLSFAPSFETHFALPRVSGLFRDLDPTSGAAEISWKQTSDLVAITWQDVPEYDITGSQNTFQVRMFFDGRIDITWLRIDSPKGLVGISEGQGEPVDFVGSDVSIYDSPGLLFDSISNKQGYVGQLLTFEVRASSDVAIPSLTAGDLPAGAGFVDNGDGSGTFSWTPGSGDVGTHAGVRFTADDSVQNLNRYISITVSVFTNAPPTASNVTISPSSPVAASELTGSYAYSDAEGDAESGTAIRWLRDGTPVESLDGMLAVPAGSTAVGESWVFSVRPHDSYVFGDTALSAAVTIMPTRDLNGDGNTNVVDIQLVINAVLGISSQGNEDVNLDGNVNAIDVQLIINDALGIL